MRAAFQAGYLKALSDILDTNPFAIITGSSVGSINGFVLSVGISHLPFKKAVNGLMELWLERNFHNTFENVGTLSFIKGLLYAAILSKRKKIIAPQASILNPAPLERTIEKYQNDLGGIKLSRDNLQAFAVMTTKMEKNRQVGALFVQALEKNLQNIKMQKLYDAVITDKITVKHCFASAALPTIMPPVKLDTGEHTAVYIDGGFVQNVPVDPAVRLGAERVLVIDVSGRSYWKKALNVPLDSKPSWELKNQEDDTCAVPKQLFKEEVDFSLGKILKEIVGKRKLSVLGPIYPLFSLFEKNLGEELAFEAATYVVLHSDFVREVAKRGYEIGLKRAPEILNRFANLSLAIR